MARLRVSRDQTNLPEWLDRPLVPHEPVYNPSIKVGTIRWALIRTTATHPKSSFLAALVPWLAAWTALLVISLQQTNGTLVVLAWVGLPLLVGFLHLAWPMLLYRLTGLPEPATRPSSRYSNIQQTARFYYGGSCWVWFCLWGNVGGFGIWLLVLIFAQSDSALAFGIVFASLLLLPPIILLVVLAFDRIRHIGGVVRALRRVSLSQQATDALLEDKTTISIANPRRRKARPEQPTAQPRKD